MNVLSQAHIVQVILNSIALSIAVGAGCTFFGLVLAIYTTRIAKRSAIIGRIFSILPIVTPPFVVGLGVTLMMGRSGYVTEWMVAWFGLTNTNWLYGFTGIWLAQVLAFTPMAFAILDGAIKTIHPSLEEASYTLRASRWQTFNGVFVPLLKPALANAFLIVVVQSLADFSNPLVLGGNFDVLATQIYFYITGSQLDYQAASTLGAFLLLFSLLVFCIQYLWIGKRSYVTVSGKSYRGDVQPLPVTLVWSVIALLAVWVAFNALLYGSIFYGSFTVNWVDYTLTLDNFIKLFGQGMSDGAWPSLLDTLLYAGIAAPITAAFGLLIAWIVVRQQFRAKDHRVHHHAVLCGAGHRGGRLLHSRLQQRAGVPHRDGRHRDYLDGDAQRAGGHSRRDRRAGPDRQIAGRSLAQPARRLAAHHHAHPAAAAAPGDPVGADLQLRARHHHRQRHRFPGDARYPRGHRLHPQPRGRRRIRGGDRLRFNSDRGDAGDYFPL